MLGTVWLAGSGLVLLWVLLGLAYGWWLSRQTRRPENARLMDRFRLVLERVGLRSNIALAESERLKIPVVFGWLRPTVILPTHASRWTDDRLHAVLLHETAHIRRWDLVYQFLAKLMCVIYWFNPLTWLIERKLFLAGERAADDQVIHRDVSPAEYAEHLMETSEELGVERTPIWATAAMAEGTAFKDRILSILDPNIRRGEPNMSDRTTVALFAVAIVFSLVTTSPWKEVSFVEAVPPSPSPTADVAAPAIAPSEASQGVADDFETLVLMLRMSDPSMREHAATALGRLGDARAVEPLSEVAVNDSVAAVREHACTALGELGDPRARQALARVMRSDPSARVREHAAEALGRLGDAASELPLAAAALEDPDPRVREHAASALGQLGDRRARDPLIEVMRTDSDASVREHGAVALGYLRDPAAFDVLLETMRGRDVEDVRAHAAFALGLLGDSRALEPLLAALQSGSAVMRSNAAQGLGELGDARALSALRQAGDDADERVRFFVQEAIRKIETR